MFQASGLAQSQKNVWYQRHLELTFIRLMKHAAYDGVYGIEPDQANEAVHKKDPWSWIGNQENKQSQKTFETVK
jgi:hypothetical protein